MHDKLAHASTPKKALLIVCTLPKPHGSHCLSLAIRSLRRLVAVDVTKRHSNGISTEIVADLICQSGPPPTRPELGVGEASFSLDVGLLDNGPHVSISAF